LVSTSSFENSPPQPLISLFPMKRSLRCSSFFTTTKSFSLPHVPELKNYTPSPPHEGLFSPAKRKTDSCFFPGLTPEVVGAFLYLAPLDWVAGWLCVFDFPPFLNLYHYISGVLSNIRGGFPLLLDLLPPFPDGYPP